MSNRGHTSSWWSWTCVGCIGASGSAVRHLWQWSLVGECQPCCAQLYRAWWHSWIAVWSPICPILFGPSSGWRLTSFHSHYTQIWQQPAGCSLDTVFPSGCVATMQANVAWSAHTHTPWSPHIHCEEPKAQNLHEATRTMPSNTNTIFQVDFKEKFENRHKLQILV